jgi:hypothetical protein
MGLEGEKKGKRRDTYFWSNTLLFCLLLFGAACTINPFFDACGLRFVPSKDFLLLCWKKELDGWIDIYTSSRTLVVFSLIAIYYYLLFC